MVGTGSRVFAILVSAAVLLVSAAVIVAPRSAAEYTMHAPILIDSDVIDDDDGVVSGNGTETDPYIIEGWQIDHFNQSSIDIVSCEKHYVIRNVFVRKSPEYGQQDYYGIHVESSSNVLIEDCLITDNPSSGVMVYGSRNIRIVDNQLSDNEIYIGASEDIVIDGNELISSSIRLFASKSVSMADNTVSSGGIFIDGLTAEDFSTHSISTTNTVRGGPVLYFSGQDSVVVDEDMTGGEIIIANCSGVSVEDLNMTGAGGLFIAYCDDVTVSNIQAYQSHPWMVLTNASRTTVSGCTVVQTSWDQDIGGYYLPATLSVRGMADSEIVGCSISGASDGITVTDAVNVSVVGCTSGGYRGISFYDSFNSTIQGNDLVTCTQPAVYLDGCMGFEVFQNNIGFNSATDSGFPDEDNRWDGGYPEGGNYWGYHDGIDDFSGEGQDVP